MINIYRNDQWFLHSDMLIQIHVRPKKGYEKGCARQFNTIQAIRFKQAAWKTRWSLGVWLGLQMLMKLVLWEFTSRHFIYSGVPYVGTMGLHQGIDWGQVLSTRVTRPAMGRLPLSSEFEGWFEDRELLAIQGPNFSLTHVNETQTGRLR